MDSGLIEEYGAEFSRVKWQDDHSSLAKEIPKVYGAGARDDVWRENYAPLESQEAFHALDTRFKGFSGPVGSGKSAALCREAIKLAFANPGCTGLIGAPTYRMLADVTRPAFRRALGEADVHGDFRASDNTIYIPACDATVLFRSLSDPDRLVGTNLAWYGVDELTYSKQASWEKLEARLREPRASQLQGFAVWTPAGFDWVYNRFKADEKKLPEHSCVFAKARENFHVAKSGYYDRLEASYDHRLFQQEVLGEYLNIFTGQAYYAFDRRRNVKKLAYDWRRPLCWAMDFNVTRMSSLLLQYVPQPGDVPAEINVLDEIILTNSHTAATCHEMLERIDKLTANTPKEDDVIDVRVYGDASGESRTSKVDDTDYEIIRRFGRRNAERIRFTFHVQDANPSIKSRIASVNGMLLNASDEVKLLIDPQCKALTEDLEQVGWSTDPHGRETGELDKKNPALTHISDALGYFAWKEAGIRQRGGPRAKTNLRY